ncbi:Disease resistance protein RPV1 [Linum perenne]
MTTTARSTDEPPAPPPLPPLPKYDVFLSFRGEDLRGKFVDHLYSKLQSLKVNTFMDDKKLQKGDLIKNITKVIERSTIYVVLFSSGYADSDWCLNELAKISNCVKKKGIFSQKGVIPKFNYHSRVVSQSMPKVGQIMLTRIAYRRTVWRFTMSP